MIEIVLDEQNEKTTYFAELAITGLKYMMSFNTNGDVFRGRQGYIGGLYGDTKLHEVIYCLYLPYTIDGFKNCENSFENTIYYIHYGIVRYNAKKDTASYCSVRIIDNKNDVIYTLANLIGEVNNVSEITYL